jgi:Lrp/AsnC family transcriptional regulator for asnA, asnC and gidA
MRKKKKIDKIDREIIAILQKDGRIPNKKIAEIVGIAESTVRARLDKLIDNKLIQIVAVGNPFDLGFEIAGNIKIRVDIKKVDNVLKKLNCMKEIWYAVLTTGGTDIDADFIVESRAELRTLLMDKINKIDGVNNTETSMIMDFIKRDFTWGTGKNL